MKINVVGRVQIYEPSGSYSIIIEKAEPDGIGALAIQFEQLRKKLTAEGYFDDCHKQALPNFVKKSGLSQVLVVRLFEILLRPLVVVFLG